MALVGLGLWLLLAFWSVRAFVRHIQSLGESDSFDWIGATAGEFALLAFILWHCFSVHINVRRWSLIFAFVLGAVILVHSGALRGIREATVRQDQTVTQLKDSLTQMSKEQMEAVKGASDEELNPISRRSADRAAAQAKKDIATTAQGKVAEEIKAGTEKVKSSSILPKWYLDGWSYSVIFALASAMVTVIFFMMMNIEDIDRNFDNIPDRLQTTTPGQSTRSFTPIYHSPIEQKASRPGVVRGNGIDKPGGNQSHS